MDSYCKRLCRLAKRVKPSSLPSLSMKAWLAKRVKPLLCLPKRGEAERRVKMRAKLSLPSLSMKAWLAKRVKPSSLPLFFEKARPPKSPYFYLGAAAVFLFIFVSFSSDLFLKSIANKSDFYLTVLAKMIDYPQVANKDSLLANQKFSPESPQFILVENSVLLASTPPTTFSYQILGALKAGHETEDVKRVITEYVVESEDTLLSLADKFDISLNTILWANDLTRKSIIKPGDKLVIPPVSGVIHYVKSGDTVSEIARIYKGKIDEIVTFNDLPNEKDIYIGDILVIPNGVMPLPARFQPAPIGIPLADSQFILPVSSPHIITQGLHWYNAVDFSHSGYACGKPVFAAAGGTVQKIDYNSRFLGNYVRVLHHNGVVTLYGHLSGIAVETGEEVNVGAIIGYIGNTGYTKGPTGCHLHFEVRGARNPFAPVPER